MIKKKRKENPSNENKWRRGSFIPNKTLYKKFTGSNVNLTNRITDYISERCNSARKKKENFNGKSFFKKNFPKTFSKKLKDIKNKKSPRKTSKGGLNKLRGSYKYFTQEKKDLSILVESQEKRIKELRNDLELSEQKIEELTSQKYEMLTQLTELQEVKRSKTFISGQEKEIEERKIKFFVDKLKNANEKINDLMKENNLLNEENIKLKSEIEKAFDEILTLKLKDGGGELINKRWVEEKNNYEKEIKILKENIQKMQRINEKKILE